MIRVDIWLPDPKAVLTVGVFGPGALIRVERADLDLAPPFALGAFAEVHTMPVVGVPPQLAYPWWDPAGITTSVYRWRVSTAVPVLPADYSPYSPTFAGVSPSGTILPPSYATMERALRQFETPPTTAARLQRLAEALGDATSEIIHEMAGRDYFRHPDTGTSTWVLAEYDADGPILHMHDGIVSCSLLEVSWDRGATFTALTADQWALRATGPREELTPGGHEPAFHIELVDTVLTRRGFPMWPGSVRFTGVRGWPSIPLALALGTAARARQTVYADPSYSGSIPGPAEYATSGAQSFERWPQATYRFMKVEHERFSACIFANDRTLVGAGSWGLGPW